MRVIIHAILEATFEETKHQHNMLKADKQQEKCASGVNDCSNINKLFLIKYTSHLSN